jgi:transcriptional regulator with XRE-family HTH domain
MTVSIKIERDQVAYGKRLAARLRSVMGSRSATEWAKELGIPQRTLANYLKGRIPPADIVAHICKHERASPAWLLFGAERDENDHIVLTALDNLRTLAQQSRHDADRVLDLLGRSFSTAMLADPEFWGRRK